MSYSAWIEAAITRADDAIAPSTPAQYIQVLPEFPEQLLRGPNNKPLELFAFWSPESLRRIIVTQTTTTLATR
eukprot:jgi/Psemu1/8800/gm1.8800_g